MKLAMLFFFAASTWQNGVDLAFTRAAGQCGQCHANGYTISVRLEMDKGADVLDQHEKFDAKDEKKARDWAKKFPGACGITVTMRPKVKDGWAGMGTYSECKEAN